MSERRKYTGHEQQHAIKANPNTLFKDVERPPVTPIMILNEVARLWHHRVEDGAPTQFMQNSNRAILRELSFKAGVCQLDLARATHLKAPTISVALNKMENEGLVTRIADEMDLRATRVYLTEKGLDINNQLRDRIHEADKVALSDFTEQEKKTLISLLERIKNNLSAESKD